MDRLLRPFSWQVAFFSFAVLVLALLPLPGSEFAGLAVLESEDTEPFAPPYDPFDRNLITALSFQPADNETFTVRARVDLKDGVVYKNAYYYTVSGWQQIDLSAEEWTEGPLETTVTESYANMQLREGDDFFMGVWACKAFGDEWRCGCSDVDDCGYWFLQGIDIETESACVDQDGDGYGVEGFEDCFMAEPDCDDTDASVNPGETEVPYNGKDDDCDPLTPDDDLDGDGYVLADDCDDADPRIHPGASETCGDGIDQDCDGSDQECIPGSFFVDGFESGSASNWDYLNPNSRVNADLPRVGSYSLNLIYSSGDDLKKDQYAEVSLAEGSRLFHRYYVHFEEDFLHGVSGVTVSSFGGDWRVEQVVRRWQGDASQGRLFVVVDGTEYVTGHVFENGAWYCVEEEVAVDSLVRLWVDGSLVLEQTGLSFGGSDIGHLRQGGLYRDVLEAPINLYVDDVVVSDARIGC